MSQSKQSSYDINFKIAVIEAVNSGRKRSLVAEEFKIPKSTLSTFMRDKDKIYASVASGSVSSKSKRMRSAKHKLLETELLRWFKNVRQNNVSLSGRIVKTKAKKIAENLKISDFQFSDGWFARFKKRHGITSQKVGGEAYKVSEAHENFNDFVAIDNDVAVCDSLELEDACLPAKEEDDDDDEECDDEPEPRAPSREEVYAALDVLKNYAATNNISQPIPDEDSKSQFDLDSDASPSDVVTPPTPERVIPANSGKKRKGGPDSTDQLVRLATEYFKRPETEEDILAKIWAMKLKELIPDQRRFAEKIINDTLFEAQIGTLSREEIRFITQSCWANSPPRS